MDVAVYTKVMEKFLMRMTRITEVSSVKLQSALEDICDFLRIGKIKVFSYMNSKSEENGQGTGITYYRKGQSAKEAAFCGRHGSGKGSALVFMYYQKLGETPWSAEELSKLELLDNVLYTFDAKLRLSKFAEKSMYFDGELQVPNMSYFHKSVNNIIQENRFTDYAVCFFNLKRFSVINQLWGRENGTKIMIKFVLRLKAMFLDRGNVCRVGGDNFIAYFEKKHLDNVVSYLSGTEIEVDDSRNESVQVRACAGIFEGDDNTDNVESVIDKAHLALQSAKRRISDNIVFFSSQLQHMHEHASWVESVFKEAIEKEEFQVYYQPKVQLNDYKIAGAEALCRWFYEGKFVRPDEFIPILEQSNAICTLDFYMLEQVCKNIRSWIDKDLNVVRVSVNFSRRHLGDEKLLDKILSIVDKYSVPHKYIEIELTETTTDVAFHDLKLIVNGLHEHGIHTSVDDFGVGYSSLNLIRQVAWDVIKIDKSFLPDVSDKTSSQYLMFSHLLSMFRELGLKCIVEGVETIEQVKMLKDNKCILAQGYFFDKPLELCEFETRLSN